MKLVSNIEGFEDATGYLISEDGILYSENRGNRKIFKQQLNTKGYRVVTLKTRKTVSVHRLVALAYIPNPENKEHVNHIDGNKENNHVSNLEWATASENNKHAFVIGLSTPRRGSLNYQYDGNHSNCKMIYQYDMNGKYLASYKSIALASRSLGFKRTNSSIGKAANGYVEQAVGYLWSFDKKEDYYGKI